MIAFFRQWAKGFIWFIVIAFLGACFLGSASIFFLLDQDVRRDRQGRDVTGDARVDGNTGESREENPRLHSERVVAEVTLGDQKATITEADLERRVLQAEAVRGQRLGEDARKFWRPIVLDNMVDEELVLLQARSLHLDVREDVIRQMQQLFSQVGKAEYLRKTGQTEEEVLELLTERFEYEKMLAAVRKGRAIPESEARAYYEAHEDEFQVEGETKPRPFEAVRERIERILRARIEPEHVREYYQSHRTRWQKPPKVHLYHFALDTRSDARTEASSPTAAEIEQWYREHPEDFRSRQKVTFAHLFVDPEHPDFRERARPSRAEVQEYYALNQDEFAGEEELELWQIVLSGDDAMAGAEAALERIGTGEPFSEVAKDVSEDEDSRDEGGSLGYVTRLDLDAEVADVAFELEPGRISEPVAVGDRVHLFRVGERREGGPRPLAEVRDEIARGLESEKRWEVARKRAEKLAEQLEEGRDSFAELVTQFSHAASAATSGVIGTVVLGENPKSTLIEEVGTEGFLDFGIQKALRETDPGEVTDPVRSFKGFHLLHVIEKPAPAPRPLEEVRVQVERAVREHKADELVQGILDEVRQVVLGGAERADPEKVVERFQQQVEKYSESVDVPSLKGDWGEVYLDPTTPPELPPEVLGEIVSWNGLSRRIVEAVEDLEAGELSEVVELSGKKHLFLIGEVLPAEYAPLEDVEEEIRLALYPHVTEEELKAYFEANRDEFQAQSSGGEYYHCLFHGREDALEALAEIRAGEKTFEEVASGPSNIDRVAAANGGRIQGRVAIPSVRQALETGTPGEVYPDPVQSPVGWHLLKVGARDTPEELGLEDVRDRIEDKLLQEKEKATVQGWMQELRNRARIETHLEGAGGLGDLRRMLGGLGRG